MASGAESSTTAIVALPIDEKEEMVDVISSQESTISKFNFKEIGEKRVHPIHLDCLKSRNAPR